MGTVHTEGIKTRTIVFPESTTRTQTQTITIPNVKTATIKSITSGTADITVNGDEVTVTAKNGTARRVQTGGSYTPGDSKEVTSYTNVTFKQSGHGDKTNRFEGIGKDTWDQSNDHVRNNPTKNYSSGGYSGTLYLDDGKHSSKIYHTPDSPWEERIPVTHIWEAKIAYSGTVTKPPSDTRTYADYYGYTIEIEYTDNVSPTISVNNQTKDITIDGEGRIDLTGLVTDTDDDQVTVQATIGGITKTFSFKGPDTDRAWQLTWMGDELTEGEYRDIIITVDDNIDTNNTTYKGTITVDKTKPTLTIKLEV